MFDGKTYQPTLDQIAAEVAARYGLHATGSGLSARVRDLRKARFGGYEVERKRIAGGLWAYRIVFGGRGV
jgi:hypothetical protein